MKHELPLIPVVLGSVGRNSVCPPPYGGPEPSWIAGKYAEDVWVSKEVSPTRACPYMLDFGTIPVAYRPLAKWYIWAVEYVEDPSVVRLRARKAATFVAHFGLFRRLTVLLTDGGFNRLDKLDPAQIGEHFLQCLAGGCADRRKGHSGTVSASTLIKWRSLFERLHILGPDRLCLLPDGLRVAVQEKHLAEAARRYKPRSPKKKPKLDEEQARSLINLALRWVRDLAGPVTTLRKAWIAFRQHVEERLEKKLHHMDEGVRVALARKFFSRNPLGTALKDAIVRLSSEIAEKTGQRAEDVRLSTIIHSMNTVSAALCSTLVAACYAVIGAYSGFRISEVLSLREGWVLERGGRFIMLSVIRKTSIRRSGQLVERPVPEPVKEAAAALELHAALHPKRGEGVVWITGGGGKVHDTWTNDWLKRLGKLAGLQRNISTHDLRHFFAMFYIRRYRGPEDGIRRHFRHTSSWMLDYYINDSQGARFLATEKKKLAHEIMNGLVFGDSGFWARELGSGLRNAVAKYRASNLPVPEITRRIELHLEARFLEVVANEWGYCLVQQEGSSGAACADENGLPDPVNRCPATCCGCIHFAAGEENAEFWRHTRLLHQQVVSDPLAAPAMVSASQKLLRRIDKLISGLETEAAYGR